MMVTAAVVFSVSDEVMLLASARIVRWAMPYAISPKAMTKLMMAAMNRTLVTPLVLPWSTGGRQLPDVASGATSHSEASSKGP
jgi:hypothetical protein